MLAHRLRRWPNIKPPLAERFVFAGLGIMYCYILTNKDDIFKFQLLEVVSRYRDPQPQVVENLFNLRLNMLKS